MRERPVRPQRLPGGECLFFFFLHVCQNLPMRRRCQKLVLARRERHGRARVLASQGGGAACSRSSDLRLHARARRRLVEPLRLHERQLAPREALHEVRLAAIQAKSRVVSGAEVANVTTGALDRHEASSRVVLVVCSYQLILQRSAGGSTARLGSRGFAQFARWRHRIARSCGRRCPTYLRELNVRRSSSGALLRRRRRPEKAREPLWPYRLPAADCTHWRTASSQSGSSTTPLFNTCSTC